jgi:hypothetical protein
MICPDCGEEVYPKTTLHWCAKKHGMVGFTVDLLRITAIREWWKQVSKKWKR